MLTLLNRFSKHSIVILGFLAITFSHAQDERAEDISILDVDASGEVDALTDGLLLLRSMFGLTDDVLTTGVVSSDATVSDATSIDSYITSMKDTTYGKLNSSGEPGPAGPQGEKGDKGDTGPQGEKGDTGSQGIQGVKGDTGSQGIAGTDGVDGAKGDTGATGAKGDTGATGVQGIQGIKGDTGSQGIAGTDGVDGAKGDTGATGVQGIQGIKGDTGSQGIAGAKGDTGATGPSGVAGSVTELTDALVEDNSIYIGNDPSATTSTAQNNVSIGTTALDSITTGDGNTAIGASADVGSGGLTNATAIGNGAIVTASNTMQLGNTSVTNVKTSGSVTAGAITIPNTDGSNGQLLATDGSGQLYWLTLVPLTEAQASAITANTAKTGITSGQASAITANTAKTGISNAQVEAINQISVNTEILSSYDSAITANTAKTGITSSQASAITANTAKTGMTLGTTSSTALAGDALSGTVNIGQLGATTTVKGTLNVYQAATLDASLTVAANKTSQLGGDVTVNGDIDTIAAEALKLGPTNASSVKIAGPTVMTTIEGTLNVDEAVTLDTSLTVAANKTSQLGGDVTVKSSIDTISAGALELGKATATSVNIAESGVMTTIEGTLNVDEAVTLDSSLVVTGVSTFSGQTALIGDVSIGGALGGRIGFYGAVPVQKPVVTRLNPGSLNVAVNEQKINEIISVLEELGLIN